MKLSTIEVTGDVKVTKNNVSGNVLTRRSEVSGNVSQALNIKSAEWGSITGTLSNQTDLNTELTTMQRTLDRISGISVESSPINYPILTIANDIILDQETGIKWLWIKCDDGTADGMNIFLPNSYGMQTIQQIVMSAIPTDNTQLTNGAGYTSDSALSTEDIDEVCV